MTIENVLALAGNKLEGILQKLTSSTLKGVLLGAAITAIIQSSTATTVIVIGLVNSGIMAFPQAIGIVMGANIGTTVTAQILRLADISGGGFIMQMLKPTSLAPAVAFAGMICYVFLRRPKQKNLGEILLGFGILFFGMTMMEQAVYPLRDSPWFAQLFSGLTNPLLGVLAGAFVTVVIQSSSASVGILQALTTTGAITWGNAVPIILGQNIGTTATGLVASAGASRGAKRVAVVHLYFNVIGTLLFMAVLYTLKAIIGLPFWDDSITRGSIANFHTLFNTVTTVLFIPFSGLLAKLAEWTVPEKEGDVHAELELTILDERLYASPSVAIQQARKAVEQMADLSRMNQRSAISILLEYNEPNIELAEQRENAVDKLDVSVSNYLIEMNELNLSENEGREVTQLLNFVTEFERIGDYAINVIERSGEVHDKQIVFSEVAKQELQVLNEAVSEILDITITGFSHDDVLEAQRVEPLEQTIDLICDTLRERHIRRLKRGVCTIDAGIVFLEVLTDYERISDHCSNIAARIVSADLDAEFLDMHELRRNMHEGQIERYNELAAQYKEKYLPRLNESLGADTAQLTFT